MGTVLVTGASTGIGAACALRLASRGHRVFAGVRRDHDGERLVAETSTGLIEPVHIDVTVEEQVSEAAAKVAAVVGSAGLDGLVNNAGVALGGPIEFVSLADWRNQLEVNVVGQVSVTKSLIPVLREARGRIVFISSISGRITMPFFAPYCASKHAIESIAWSLREELREWGVRVSVVQPGPIRTPIWAKGRATADRLQRELGPEFTRLYGSRMARTGSQIDHQEQVGMPPSRVAAAVEHALFAPRPRHRYPVGGQAKVGAVLPRVLPDRSLAWAIRMMDRRAISDGEHSA